MLGRPIALAAALFAAAGPALAQDDARAASRATRRTAVVAAVEKVLPAVVSVGTTRIVKVRYWDWDFLAPRTGSQEQKGLGSGIVVHPSGYVVTNAHVINQADQIVVNLTGGQDGGQEVPATLLAADPDHDLALLRLDRPGPYPCVEFGRSDDLMLGETVIAIGNPFGLGRTVTTGIISALDRTLDVREAKFAGLIQTDAAVNRGNSGGALVNLAGEWIGVNSAIYSLSGGSDGISFAIPVDDVRAFVVRALRGGRFGGRWLGLEFGEAPGGGVEVTRVWPVGPAADAHVAAGSRVEGHAGLLGLCFAMLEASKTNAMPLRLVGPDGRARAVEIPFQPPPTDRLAWERLGLRCCEVDDAASDRTGFGAGTGLLVTETRKDGPAQRVGLEPGDLLVQVGGARLSVRDDLLGLLLDAPVGEAHEVKLVRSQRSRFGVSYETWKARLVVE